MGKPTGFMEHNREVATEAAPLLRISHWKEFTTPLPDDKLQTQGSRCMDCGIPTCHWACPVDNLIPDWNDLAYRGRWKDAVERLLRTNNLPEMTGRICPAPCEVSCVLGLIAAPVSIKLNEYTIVEKVFR